MYRSLGSSDNSRSPLSTSPDYHRREEDGDNSIEMRDSVIRVDGVGQRSLVRGQHSLWDRDWPGIPESGASSAESVHGRGEGMPLDRPRRRRRDSGSSVNSVRGTGGPYRMSPMGRGGGGLAPARAPPGPPAVVAAPAPMAVHAALVPVAAPLVAVYRKYGSDPVSSVQLTIKEADKQTRINDNTKALKEKVEEMIRRETGHADTERRFEGFRCVIDIQARVAIWCFVDTTSGGDPVNGDIHSFSLNETDLRDPYKGDVNELIGKLVEDLRDALEGDDNSDVLIGQRVFGGGGALGCDGPSINSHFYENSHWSRQRVETDLRGAIRQHLGKTSTDNEAIKKMAIAKKFVQKMVEAYEKRLQDIDVRLRLISDDADRKKLGESKERLLVNLEKMRHADLFALDMYFAFQRKIEDDNPLISGPGLLPDDVIKNRELRKKQAEMMALRVERHLCENVKVNQTGLIFKNNAPLTKEQKRYAAAVGALCFDPTTDHAEYMQYCKEHDLPIEGSVGIEQGVILHAVNEFYSPVALGAPGAAPATWNGIKDRIVQWLPVRHHADPVKRAVLVGDDVVNLDPTAEHPLKVVSDLHDNMRNPPVPGPGVSGAERVHKWFVDEFNKVK